MNSREALSLAHQRQRWMLPNPSRWLEPDQRKWQRPEAAWNPAALHERKYSADQPRVPAGSSEGGQWTDAGGTGEGEPIGSTANQRPRRVPVFADDRYVHLAGELPTNDPPEIPKERPPTVQERHRIARRVARSTGRLGPLMEAASWLQEFAASIQAYRDPPRSLGELQEEVAHLRAGYDIHHIVEQGPAREYGFSDNLIDGPNNLARVPRFKHWEINAWYQAANKDYGNQSPREYLRDKDWNERKAIGLRALIEHGVLKP